MKKCLLMVVAILTIAGCALGDRVGSQFFATTNGLVELQFPAGWYKNKEDNPFDLQCFSKDQRMSTGVFLYAKADLAEDVTPEEILEIQIEDLNAKRKNFEKLEEKQTVQLEEKKLTTIVYFGEKDFSKYYYRFTLVEFTEHPEIFLVVLQVATPSYWNQQKPILEQITASARIRSEAR